MLAKLEDYDAELFKGVVALSKQLDQEVIVLKNYDNREVSIRLTAHEILNAVYDTNKKAVSFFMYSFNPDGSGKIVLFHGSSSIAFEITLEDLMCFIKEPSLFSYRFSQEAPLKYVSGCWIKKKDFCETVLEKI